jgi:DNA-binding NarL/FixJ family response regulator
VHLHNIMRKLHATNRTQAAMQFGALAAEIASS